MQGSMEPETMIQPNQLTADDNKAPGLGYTIESDKLYVMVAVNFSEKKKKCPLVKTCKEKTSDNKPLIHSKEDSCKAMSQVCLVHLVLWVLLKTESAWSKGFQEASVMFHTADTWDDPLSREFREDAITLIKEYADLSQLRFIRHHQIHVEDQASSPTPTTVNMHMALELRPWHCCEAGLVQSQADPSWPEGWPREDGDVWSSFCSPAEKLLSEALSD